MLSPRSPLRTTPDDEAAGAPLTSWYTQGVTDGFGDRLLMFDNAATGPVELLRVRPDFAVVPGFESALRARFEQLSSFTHPSFAQARVVNHLENGGGLTVASTHVTGTRLSELFVATRPTPGMHPASVRDAFGDLVAAIAELHRRGRTVAHGALGAERILLTFDRQLVVTDYVFGDALHRLNLTQEQLWTEFGLVSDNETGVTRLDQRGDLAQLGLLMLSLVLGRRIGPGEYPHKIPALLRDFSTASDKRAPDATTPLRSWLEQALDPAGFRSADEAERALVLRPRRPHSVNLQAALPRGLTAPRVVASARTAPPTPAEPASAATAPPAAPAESVSAATAPPVVTTPPPVAASAVAADAPPCVSSEPAPFNIPAASTDSPAEAPSPVFVPEPSVTQPIAIIEPPPSAAVMASPLESPLPVDSNASEATAPSLVALTAPLLEPLPLVVDSPLVATPSPVVPAPPAEIEPPLVVLPPPRDVPPAPLELLPPGFLRLQSTETPTATSSLADLLMRPAAPPILVTLPSVVVPTAPAALQRPEPFGWISDRESAVDDAVMAGAARSVPTMSWLTVALAILVVTQAAIIGRLLSQQAAVPLPEVVSASAPGKTGLDSTPTGAAPVDLPQDRRSPVTPALPVAAQTDPTPEGTTRASNSPGAAETPGDVRGVGAGSRNLGGVRVISPIPLRVMLGNRFLGSSARGPVFATPGTRELDFVNDQLGFRVRQRVFLYADRVVPLRINPPNGSLVVTAQPRAQVWIDGRLAGDTPLTTSVPIGEHEVVFQNLQFGIKRQKAVVQVGSPTEVSASFIP